MSATLLEPEEQVLSTLNRDGSRRWLKPRVSRNRFWRARRAVAYILIAVFALVPYLKLNDKPMILLDIARREFTLFGRTFLPTDTLLLALLVVGIFLTVFLATALFGRLWCGWACPQTVYMEFLFRPVERWLEGEPGRARPTGNLGARKALKFVIFLFLALFLAHTFLAYFVGVESLYTWVRQSPFRHPVPFVVMTVTTLMILFDFGFFREQMCIVACPYGRFQSVMLDRDSLIVSYDKARGEPRGRAQRKQTGDVHLAVVPEVPVAERTADCVDCGLCVATCPTGIDIRDGLQMECIHCAQCIDACDTVMARLGRPLGLIRYSSQNAIERLTRHLLRPRVVIYPLILVVIASAFVYLLVTAKAADMMVLRGRGLPFNELPSGEIANQVTVRVTNRTSRAVAYTLSLSGAGGTARLEAPENPMTVEGGQTRSEQVVLIAPRNAFVGGSCALTLAVTDGAAVKLEKPCRMLGPSAAHPDDQHHDIPAEDHPKEEKHGEAEKEKPHG